MMMIYASWSHAALRLQCRAPLQNCGPADSESELEVITYHITHRLQEI